MKCPKCGELNPEEANFCGSCGANVSAAFKSEPGPVNLKQDRSSGANRESEVKPVEHQFSVDDLKSPVKPSVSQTEGQQPGGISPPSGGYQPPPPDPHLPGAGIVAPPPSTGGYPRQYGSGYGNSYGQYSTEFQNTSGMGEGYPVPPEAEGWSFAGFVPWGLFSFVNGNSLWGILYWVFGLFNLTIIYWIFVGLNGKKHAWQGRRFDSVQQFSETMQVWNTWGIVCMIASVVLVVLGIVFYMAMFAAVLADPSVYQ